MDRHERARRQDRPLHALLPAVVARTRASDEKLPNSVLYTALLAPIGSGSPTCAITTPISPAGTCTHGNFFTPNIGQILNRSPGMSSVAW